MVLTTTVNDRLKLLAPCPDEFRGSRFDTVRQISIGINKRCYSAKGNNNWHRADSLPRMSLFSSLRIFVVMQTSPVPGTKSMVWLYDPEWPTSQHVCSLEL
ncbi:hypothetical protein TNCV_3609821 [Trichonephila clavipes]|nr:hypothetical protein TNCV_3609821 [Trichonephila clavipes]